MLQAEIDEIGELLRTIKAEAPLAITDIINDSEIADNLYSDSNDGLDYLEQVYDDIEQLIEIHLDLEDATQGSREYNHLANYAQDRVRDLQKFCWMLRATLDGRGHQE